MCDHNDGTCVAGHSFKPVGHPHFSAFVGREVGDKGEGSKNREKTLWRATVGVE
jgi:hypothetical protein